MSISNALRRFGANNMKLLGAFRLEHFVDKAPLHQQTFFLIPMLGGIWA